MLIKNTNRISLRFESPLNGRGRSEKITNPQHHIYYVKRAANPARIIKKYERKSMIELPPNLGELYYTKRKLMIDWILRYVKGIFIGSGFILPGVSGGALATVFGVYERIISFLAHITRDFKKNALYLIPLGLGGMTGVFLFSFVVSYFLGAYETQILWFFIGCILGTIPALWKQAGMKGRQGKHIVILVATFFISLVFLLFGENLFAGSVPQNFSTWILAGALIGLGLIIPGLSPSNFLVYMGMYKDMSDGIKDLNFMIIIPIAIGAIFTVLLFSKLMDLIFKRAYAGLFHCILGVVFASTVMIVPRDFNYLSLGTIACLILCIAGSGLGYFMCTLEKKHKKA